MKHTATLLTALLLTACGNGIRQQYNSGEALGTTYNITYLTTEALDMQAGIDSVFAAVNASMSTYIPGSDISRINRGDSSIVVDPMFREVLAISKQVYTRTNGYFDPTVGVLVNAWGFGPEPAMEMDSTVVDSLLQFVGFDKIGLTPDNRIHKAVPGIRFDFNAIAKGYAIDRLAAMLAGHGLENFLVEVGGEVVARGMNLKKQAQWVVGIDDPQAFEERRLKKKIQLKDRALASSGNYRKFRIDSLTGRRYVHTIDPKTGYTKNSNVLAASVIANTCALADAYATAFMAMDLDESIKLLVAQKELEAYIIYLDEKGEAKEFMTTGFRELVVD
jgi:thiamine biosynthesis lipoprotein